jgi:hypothetical protein
MLKVKEIPNSIGYYLAGFADGEGSFTLSFRRRKDYRMPWKISLCFNVLQCDKVILALFKQHLRCGTLRDISNGVWYYEVNNLNTIMKNVIPFFMTFGFLSAKKKREFAKVKKLAVILNNEEHLTEEGLKKILNIRKDMNDSEAGRYKYSETDILDWMKLGKSSETTRQAYAKNYNSLRG